MVGTQCPYLGLDTRAAVGDEHDGDIVGEQTQGLPQGDKGDVEAQVGQNDVAHDLPFSGAVHTGSPELILGNALHRRGKDGGTIGNAGEQCGGNDDDKRILGDPVERLTAAQGHIYLVGKAIGGSFQQP